MRLNITKGPTWTCELCHNRNNSPISTVCSICKAERPKYQFGIQIEGRYYICKVKIISFLPSISVCEVSTTKCDFFSLDVGESENTIEECIILAIKQRQQVKQKRVSIANEDSIGFPELENEELDTLPALNNAISPKKSSLKSSNIGTGHRSTPTGTGSSSSSLLSMFDPGLSLFDTVMQNASTVAYDGKIGQYVSVKAVRQSSTEDSDGQMIKKNFSYIDSMRKERIVMTQVVKEVVKRRADDTYIYDTKADLDINRSEWEKYIECEMCERFYPKSQMPGQITFKAIADWKEAHHAPISPSDHRLDTVRLHDAKRLCIFCTQFFDINSSNLIDTTIIKERIGFHKNDINGPLNCSNTVYKRIFRKAIKIKTELEDRPLSRMRHRIALEQLRFKSKMKENTESRFLFNPKVMNSVVDQEKVGKFLRNKYVQSSAGAVLLSEKKASNKLTLQPMRSTAPSSSSHNHTENTTSSSSAFLTCANNDMNHIADTTISQTDQVKARRSLSASIVADPPSSSSRRVATGDPPSSSSRRVATGDPPSSSSRRVATGDPPSSSSRRVATGNQKSIIKERNLHSKEKHLNTKVNKNTPVISATTPLVSNTAYNTSNTTSTGTGNSLDLLNNTTNVGQHCSSSIVDNNSSSILSPIKKKKKKQSTSKSVSFSGAAASVDSLTSLHSPGENHREVQQKQQNKKKKGRQQSNGSSTSNTKSSSEIRRPLILKVSSAAVVGSTDSAKIIEIELPAGAYSGSGGSSIVNNSDQQQQGGVLQNSRSGRQGGALSPLKGLLQNMKLTKREPLPVGLGVGSSSALPTVAPTTTTTTGPAVVVRGAGRTEFTEEKDTTAAAAALITNTHTQDAEHSSSLHNNNSNNTSPIKLKVKKTVKINSTALSSQQQQQQSPIYNQKNSSKKDAMIDKNIPLSVNTGNNKTSEKLKSPKYSNQPNSMSWKNNINKPVLFKESNTTSSSSTTTSPAKTVSTKQQSSSHLEVEEEECGEVSDDDGIGSSSPTEQHHISQQQQQQRADSGLLSKTRSDSFASDVYSADEYDDSFEADEEPPTGYQQQQEVDPWAGDTMEGYNWVSAGPYLPEEQGEEGSGFSPVIFEASLLGQSKDRMRMLSRGSAGGLMTPTSRNNTAGSRRYSRRQTPKLLSSAGDVGFLPPSSSSSRNPRIAQRTSQELPVKATQRHDSSTSGGSVGNTNSSSKATLLRKVDQASLAYSGGGTGSGSGPQQAAAVSVPMKPRRRARA